MRISARIDNRPLRRPALVVALLICSAIAVLAAGHSASAGASGPATARVERVSSAGVRDYWTSARMLAAEPVGQARIAVPWRTAPAGPSKRIHDGFSRSEVPDPSAVDVRMHGKVFFTSKGVDYLCSGTAVDAPNHSTVLTAGHCVSEAGEFATNWMFAPAYDEGATPFGEWPASELIAPAAWVSSENFSFDAGFAIVERNGAGRGIEDVVGARPVAFNQPRSQAYHLYGYPAEQPPLEFNGEREYRCDTHYAGDETVGDEPMPMFVGCDLTAGSSGGSWVTNGGSVASLISYGYPIVLITELNHLYGPYFGDEIESTFTSAASGGRTCKGAPVTQLGAGGPDTLSGTGKRDVIHGGGGADVLIGRGGEDMICGGRGADRLEGGPGPDILAGGRGADICAQRRNGPERPC